MVIKILCENTSSGVGCLAEWGFSAWIEFDGNKILFDTGYSDVYVQNAKKIGVNLEEVDTIVFSHFHSDHTRGLQFHPFKSIKKVVCHPEVLTKIPNEEAKVFEKNFSVSPSKNVVEFAPGAFFLGEVPRKTPFEKGVHKGDDMRDDSALAFKTEKGVVVVSGCSHSGICNICEYAKEITALPLYAVIGGFHLFEKDQEAVQGTLEYFQKEKPPQLFPMHCVDFPTFAKFHAMFGTKKVAAGESIELN